ncbi:MAG: hypothetical protein HQK96_21375 [Nitrospirae bacterium]|nr:hypothetical protein [Nitrospirota bacterium]
METFNFLTPFIIPSISYGIGAMGIALVFNFLKFPDFTALGSLMVGGVICVWVSNHSNALFGIFFGALSGGVLGLGTGFLASKLRIPKVLAGIIIYTASFSVGYSLTEGGNISLAPQHSLLGPLFEFKQAVVIFIIAIIICSLISYTIKTKIGSLVVAMTATKDYLSFRHRYKSQIFILIIFIGNLLVGLTGSLDSLYNQQVSVLSNENFFPICLGAIFGGNAISLYFSQKLQKSVIINDANYEGNNSSSSLIYKITSVFSKERDESEKIGFTYFTYIMGCLFLKEIDGLVSVKFYKRLIPTLDIPFEMQHLIIALIITLTVWWSGVDES